MKALILSMLAAAAASPQTSIEKQRASIQIQREAIRKQMGTAPAADSFFATPWLDAMPVPPPAVPVPPPAMPVTPPAMPVTPPAASLPPPEPADPSCDRLAAEKLDALVEDAAKREGLKPDVVRAVIGKESAGDPCAVSMKGAMGLMQLMPATAGMLSVTDPFDPKQNVDAGTKYLKQLLDRYKGDLSLALGAYNAGPGRVDPVRGLPPIPETLDYVADILGRLKP